MELIEELVRGLNGLVWGPPMLILILGTGFFLMVGLRVMPLIRLTYGFRMLWAGRKEQGEGDITPFNALMTSLSATIGTGNIAGVGTAIAIGGPGALFWMWCTALVGMATKYAEAVLAVKYREVDEEGNHVGGPMYYIKNGLGRNWIWLGGAFAVFGALAGFGIGNGVQANSVADALETKFHIDYWITGVVMAVLVGLVIIGGIRWIAQVAGKLVPFMAIAYVLGGLTVLVINIAEIPGALALILSYAFTPNAEIGGFAGATVMLAVRFGVARGIFSNEAGLGSAPIAHAAAETDNPVRQGTVAMLGTFIDTIIICTITGLVIVTSGQWRVENPEYVDCVGNGGALARVVSSSWGIEQTKNTCVLELDGEETTFDRVQTGASLSAASFSAELPGIGGYIVTLGLVLFAFTSVLGWSVYGERCVEYLFGVHAIVPFRVLWVIAIPLGATVSLDFMWLVADTLNALMALPNLIALLLLSPVVFKMTRDYFRTGRG
ncbi:MAG: sodium:alanine symporter family protein [Chromatiaceae bacterium]|nr:sodium:alanine symporter family protein [Chromatiaceae bacterium]